MRREKAFLPNKAILPQRASKARQPRDLCACEWWHNQAGACYEATPPQPSLRTHAAPTCLPAGAGAAPQGRVAWVPARRDPWPLAGPAAAYPDAGARLDRTKDLTMLVEQGPGLRGNRVDSPTRGGWSKMGMMERANPGESRWGIPFSLGARQLVSLGCRPRFDEWQSFGKGRPERRQPSIWGYSPSARWPCWCA